LITFFVGKQVFLRIFYSIFLDFEDRLRDLLAYHMNIKSGGYFDSAVRKFVGIDCMDDDTVILSEGGMRATCRSSR
jgi:hypothetical protein